MNLRVRRTVVMTYSMAFSLAQYYYWLILHSQTYFLVTIKFTHIPAQTSQPMTCVRKDDDPRVLPTDHVPCRRRIAGIV